MSERHGVVWQQSMAMHAVRHANMSNRDYRRALRIKARRGIGSAQAEYEMAKFYMMKSIDSVQATTVL